MKKLILLCTLIAGFSATAGTNLRALSDFPKRLQQTITELNRFEKAIQNLNNTRISLNNKLTELRNIEIEQSNNKIVYNINTNEIDQEEIKQIKEQIKEQEKSGLKYFKEVVDYIDTASKSIEKDAERINLLIEAPHRSTLDLLGDNFYGQSTYEPTEEEQYEIDQTRINIAAKKGLLKKAVISVEEFRPVLKACLPPTTWSKVAPYVYGTCVVSLIAAGYLLFDKNKPAIMKWLKELIRESYLKSNLYICTSNANCSNATETTTFLYNKLSSSSNQTTGLINFIKNAAKEFINGIEMDKLFKKNNCDSTDTQLKQCINQAVEEYTKLKK